MATAFNCTTPEEGWNLYSHFLGNLLLIIQTAQEIIDAEDDEEKKDKERRVINDTWAKLVGYLYVIRCRLVEHKEEAAKMQEIVDMLINLDLTKPEAREAISAKHQEFNTKAGEFADQFADIRKKYEKKE